MGQKEKIISIFGSGHLEENFPEYQRAFVLGRILAENGYTVCTGGYGGIMEAAARGAKQVGGKTLAVIAKELNPHANRWMDKVKTEKTWKDRLFRLVDVADAYVVFDGGSGTLTELFVVWEMMNKKLMNKLTILHSLDMIRFYRRLKKNRLLMFHSSVVTTPSPRKVIQLLDQYFAIVRKSNKVK